MVGCLSAQELLLTCGLYSKKTFTSFYRVWYILYPKVFLLNILFQICFLDLIKRQQLHLVRILISHSITQNVTQSVITNKLYIRTDIWNFLALWLVPETVACFLNCLDRVVPAHPFSTMATFLICFLSLAVGKISTFHAIVHHFSSQFRGIWFLPEHPCSHCTADMFAEVPTVSLSPYIWSYNFTPFSDFQGM